MSVDKIIIHKYTFILKNEYLGHNNIPYSVDENGIWFKVQQLKYLKHHPSESWTTLLVSYLEDTEYANHAFCCQKFYHRNFQAAMTRSSTG